MYNTCIFILYDIKNVRCNTSLSVNYLQNINKTQLNVLYPYTHELNFNQPCIVYNLIN